MKFEKISEEAFKKDCEQFIGYYDESWYDNICIPERSTNNSAGYDFRSPIPDFDSSHFPVKGDNTVMIPTGIKADIDDDKVLLLIPRSSLGIKGVMLSNTVGVIDSDYYNNEKNEGDIIVAINFYKKVVNPSINISIKQKDKIAQGIITKYFITENESKNETRTVRTGGFGSTGR